MIEMPLNRAVPTSAPSPVAGDSASSDNEGAFAEMLGRNLGERIVSGRGHQQNGESEQDAAHGGAAGGGEFYQGAIVTPWAPPPADADKISHGSFAVVSESPMTPPVTRQNVPAALEPLVDSATSTTTGLLAGSSGHSPSSPPGGGRSMSLTTPPPVIPVAPGTTPHAPAQPVSFHLDYPVGPLPAERQHAAPAVTDAAPATPTATPLTPVPAPPPSGAAPMATTVAGEPRPGEGQAEAGPAATPGGAPTPTQSRAEVPVTASFSAGQDHGQAAATRHAQTGIITDTPVEPALATEQSLAEVGGPQSAATPNGTPAAKPQVVVPSSLINRVLEAIEHQQSQPPPRMVVVDMPELEGLRLMVSLQSDGKVHVSPLAGSAPPQVAEPFVVAVGEALAAEGFDLAKNSDDAAHGRGERSDHNNPEELPQRGRQPRRPQRSAGLRL